MFHFQAARLNPDINFFGIETSQGLFVVFARDEKHARKIVKSFGIARTAHMQQISHQAAEQLVDAGEALVLMDTDKRYDMRVWPLDRTKVAGKSVYGFSGRDLDAFSRMGTPDAEREVHRRAAERKKEGRAPMPRTRGEVLTVFFPGIKCVTCGAELQGKEARIHPSIVGPRGGKKYECASHAHGNPRHRFGR